jgi:hypothetical protein
MDLSDLALIESRLQRLQDRHADLVEQLHTGLKAQGLARVNSELQSVAAEIRHLRNACGRLYNSL